MIVITMTTFNRLAYAEQTLIALATYLRSSEPLHFHLADDGSAPEYRERLWELAHFHFGDRVTITNSERRGYGANVNAASQVTHQLPDVSAIAMIEDDWQLLRPLDLDPLVEALLTDGRIGCVRMGNIGYTMPLRCEFIDVNDQHFLLFDPASPETHVFTGHPRLETVAWQRAVGPWPELAGPGAAGATELAVCAIPAARRGVAWPIDLVKPRGDLFAHVGTIQAGAVEPEREAVAS